MTKQYGFDFDPGRCVQCHACEVACKTLHHLEKGITWRRIEVFWDGCFPKVTSRGVSFSCLHCGNPPCVAACPQKAITKRPEDGIVTVDQDKCIGCHLCLLACPFGVPQFSSAGKMEKCDLCMERVTEGKQPACVATCPSEALRFGTLQELSAQAIRLHAQKIIVNE